MSLYNLQSNNILNKNIYIASDHAGYELKKNIIDFYLPIVNIIDLGCSSTNSVDYPDYAKKLCNNIKTPNDYGILICGTGIGMCIAANKFKNIRCALVYDTYTSEMSRKHNNSNIISLGSRKLNLQESIDIINIFLQTDFEKGRHQQRINKL